MGKLKILPQKLSGNTTIPPSKSVCHRHLICGGLSNGTSFIQNMGRSKDISATISGMSSFGAKYHDLNDDTLEIQGNPAPRPGTMPIDCNESGSTLRFLMPLCGICGEETSFTGSSRLFERPLDPYFHIFDEQGINYVKKNPLTICGKLKGGRFSLPGNISSQFISGLLFALPLLDRDSQIEMTTPTQSIGYIDITIDVMKQYGISIENDNYQLISIKGNQAYQPTSQSIEGDFSQAAFFMAAGLLGMPIKMMGLNEHSVQGDKEILSIIKRMNGNIAFERTDDTSVYTASPSPLSGSIIDVSQCPDLVPILAVLCALSEGKSEIVGAERLRMKESDRLTSITTELRKLGADITEHENSLTIHGKDRLSGGEVDSWNDHRIAMSLAIASIRCDSPVILNGAESVNKSYPHFWEDFQNLGGEFYELHLG